MKFHIPFVHNVRRGLATNSSSSHSLVYFDRPRPGHDELSYAVDTQFGWDQFRLRTRSEKLMYVLVSVLQRDGMNTGWTNDTPISPELEKFVDAFPEMREQLANASSGYIDHQSVSDPEKLLAAALDPNVEIWGGNDNDGDPHDSYTDYDADYNKVIDESKKPEGLVKVEYLN
jgi:hypothetical protein